MKNIFLHFLDAGYKENYQYNVLVYDKEMLLYDERTYNGKVKLCLKPNKSYKLVVKSFRGFMTKTIYVNDKTNNIVLFYNKKRPITFILTDANYPNLLIVKGEIFLNG